MRVAVLAIALTWLATGALAAGPSGSQSSWTLRGERVEGWVWIDRVSLESFAAAPGRSAPAELGGWLAAEHLRSGIRFDVDGRACAPIAGGADPRPGTDGSLVLDLSFDCPHTDGARRLGLRVDALLDRLLAHGHVARIRVGDGPVVEAALWSGERSLAARLDGSGARAVRPSVALASAPLLWLLAACAGLGPDAPGARRRRLGLLSVVALAAAIVGGSRVLAADPSAATRVAAIALLLLLPWPSSLAVARLGLAALAAPFAGGVGLVAAAVCARGLAPRLEHPLVAALGGAALGAVVPPGGPAVALVLAVGASAALATGARAGALIAPTFAALGLALGLPWALSG